MADMSMYRSPATEFEEKDQAHGVDENNWWEDGVVIYG